MWLQGRHVRLTPRNLGHRTGIDTACSFIYPRSVAMGDQLPREGEGDFARVQARSLSDLGDFDGARERLLQAIHEAPDNPELHAQMAWFSFKCRSIDPHERDRLAQHHLTVSFEASPGNV